MNKAKLTTSPKAVMKMARDSWITSEHVGGSFEVHNGRSWVLLRPTAEHVDMRFGSYVKTRVHKVSAHKKDKGKRK